MRLPLALLTAPWLCRSALVAAWGLWGCASSTRSAVDGPPRLTGTSTADAANAEDGAASPNADDGPIPPPPPPLSPEDTPPGSTPLLPQAPAAAAPATKTQPKPTSVSLLGRTGQTLGQAGGVAIEALGSTGEWLAFCQPTHAGKSEPRDMPVDERGAATLPVDVSLHVGQESLPIEDLLAFDASGRFLVTLEDGGPVLRDVKRKLAHSLAALHLDLRSDSLPEHRSFAFAADGSTLIALEEPKNGRQRALLFDLGLGAPTEKPTLIELGERPVWRVWAEHSTFVFATLAPGTPDARWPVPPWPSPVLRCTSQSFAAYSRLSGPLRDPNVEHALLLPGQAKLTPAPGFVLGFGESWVRREDDGRLLVVSGPAQKQLASASCGGRILHADLSTGWFLVACEEYRPAEPTRDAARKATKKPGPPKSRFPLYLLKPGVVRDLETEIMRTSLDLPAVRRSRFVALRSVQGLGLVDLESGRLEQLGLQDRALLIGPSGVVVSRAGQLEARSGPKALVLGPAPAPLEPAVTEGDVLALGTRVIELSIELGAEPFLWHLPRAPLAVAGRIAVLPSAPATATHWARGPLELALAPISPGAQPSRVEGVASAMRPRPDSVVLTTLCEANTC